MPLESQPSPTAPKSCHRDLSSFTRRSHPGCHNHTTRRLTGEFSPLWTRLPATNHQSQPTPHHHSVFPPFYPFSLPIVKADAAFVHAPCKFPVSWSRRRPPRHALLGAENVPIRHCPLCFALLCERLARSSLTPCTAVTSCHGARHLPGIRRITRSPGGLREHCSAVVVNAVVVVVLEAREQAAGRPRGRVRECLSVHLPTRLRPGIGTHARRPSQAGQVR